MSGSGAALGPSEAAGWARRLQACSRAGGCLLLLGPDCKLEVSSALPAANTNTNTNNSNNNNTSNASDSSSNSSTNTIPGPGTYTSTSLSLDPRSDARAREVFHAAWSRLASAVSTGFHLATAAGPLMLEPMHGVGFAVESVEVSAAFPGLAVAAAAVGHEGLLQLLAQTQAQTQAQAQAQPQVQSGQLISDTLEALRLSFLSCPVRVVEPVFACDLQCDQSQLGPLYAVLSRRRGEVVKEDVIDGTSLFVLSATIPVAESFGFAQELLKKTSGNATAPQMVFSHWRVQDTDPFWKATTQEELEDHGDTSALAAHSNPARACIDRVRKRKGQAVEEKVVASAEKQRTLNKKK